MKKILFVFLVLSTNLFAQEPFFLFSRPAPPSPTIEEYEENFNKQKNISTDIFNFSNWEDIKLIHKKNNSIILFKEMSDFDKSMFCLLMGERTSVAFQKLEKNWIIELKKFDDPTHKLVANGDKKLALKPDVEKYLEKLQNIKKEFNNQYLMYAEKIFIKFENEITKIDKESYLKKIKERMK